MHYEWFEQNLNTSFDYACRTRPTRLAVRAGEQEQSYGELQRSVFRLAHGLRRLGVERDTRVACILDNSLQLTGL